MNMPDSNTVALRLKMAKDDHDDELMRMAEARRPELVSEFIADYEQKNQEALQNLMADMVCDRANFLNGLQRIHVIAQRPITPESEKHIASIALSMLRMFQTYVDIHEGDDIVEASTHEN